MSLFLFFSRLEENWRTSQFTPYPNYLRGGNPTLKCLSKLVGK